MSVRERPTIMVAIFSTRGTHASSTLKDSYFLNTDYCLLLTDYCLLITNYCLLPPAYSLGLASEAQTVEVAVEEVLTQGYRTYDIMDEGKTQVGTKEMGRLIAEKVGG